jgi:thiol-disulfide isomerase/thioredoxin
MLYDSQKNQQTLDTFQGKVVILNFWGDWCPACVHEMPSLNRLAQQLNPNQFVVLAVAIDTSFADAKSFFARHKLNALTSRFFLEKSLPEGYLLVNTFPTTVILNQEGFLLGRYIGAANWDSKEAIERISSLFRVKKP